MIVMMSTKFQTSIKQWYKEIFEYYYRFFEFILECCCLCKGSCQISWRDTYKFTISDPFESIIFSSKFSLSTNFSKLFGGEQTVSFSALVTRYFWILDCFDTKERQTQNGILLVRILKWNSLTKRNRRRWTDSLTEKSRKSFTTTETEQSKGLIEILLLIPNILLWNPPQK